MQNNNRFRIYQFRSFSLARLNRQFYVSVPTPADSTVDIYGIRYYKIKRTALNKLINANPMIKVLVK